MSDMIVADFEAVMATPASFQISEKDRECLFGDYRLLLPVGYYRVPFNPRLGADEYITGGYGGIVSSSYYFRRLDLHDSDDILYKTWAEYHKGASWSDCIEKKYRREILRINDGETKTSEGTIDYGTGSIDFIRTEKSYDGNNLRRYQAMFYPDAGDWRQCSLYSEHLIIWSENSNVIINEHLGLSTALLEILGTLRKV